MNNNDKINIIQKENIILKKEKNEQNIELQLIELEKSDLKDAINIFSIMNEN